MGTGKMDSSVVYALFEELKQKIDELGKRNTENDQSNPAVGIGKSMGQTDGFQEPVNQKDFSAEQMKELRSDIAQVTAYTIEKIHGKLFMVSNELKSILNGIGRKIELSRANENVTVRKEHVFIIDFRSSKTAVTIIAMVLIILSLIAGNIWQFNNNALLKDNDLKYRYVKMKGKAKAQDLSRLETVFVYERNQDSIATIRNRVETYEQLVKQEVEKRQREKLEMNRTFTK